MSDRDLLMIPGPIELEPSVLAVLGERQRGHLDPVFMKRFSRVLKGLREVFRAPTAQPFVLAGSGTLAMELAAANLVQPGEAALVVNTGYFSDRMGLALTRHGAEVAHVRSPPGAAPSLDEVKKALASQKFKVMTVTHVDTSTGVLAPVQEYAALAREAGVLSVVDGVCSVGAEALDMDAWGVDCALTGSQKALGAPPGLAVLLAGPRAMAAWRARTQPVRSLYLDFGEWLAIHEAYEAEKPSYFATPPVNLLAALDVSVGLILAEGMPARVARHVRMANAMRAAFKAMGLTTLPVSEGLAAHTLSALYYPAGVDAALVKAVAAQGVVIAGGLHPELKTKYFRVGHMGAVGANDVLATVSAVERALVASKAAVEPGSGVAAAERALA
jgi:alanine-glyoxylate transaminase/serine-glyoxylate transaminase/serine-pyruvate transaminase